MLCLLSRLPPLRVRGFFSPSFAATATATAVLACVAPPVLFAGLGVTGIHRGPLEALGRDCGWAPPPVHTSHETYNIAQHQSQIQSQERQQLSHDNAKQHNTTQHSHKTRQYSTAHQNTKCKKTKTKRKENVDIYLFFAHVLSDGSLDLLYSSSPSAFSPQASGPRLHPHRK